jgi:glutathione S-transferase
MILYGNENSGHSYKIRSLLLLLDCKHDYYSVDLSVPRILRDDEFKSISKFGEVPILVDNNISLCQSNSILIYLAQKTNKYNGTKDEWQNVLEWLSWEANRIGFSIPNLRFLMLWDRSSNDILMYIKKRALNDLKTLDYFLSSSEFLLPSGPTIADISCSAYLFWLSQAGLSENSYPNVARWLSALRNLPNWLHPDIALNP